MKSNKKWRYRRDSGNVEQDGRNTNERKTSLRMPFYVGLTFEL